MQVCVQYIGLREFKGFSAKTFRKENCKKSQQKCKVVCFLDLCVNFYFFIFFVLLGTRGCTMFYSKCHVENPCKQNKNKSLDHINLDYLKSGSVHIFSCRLSIFFFILITFKYKQIKVTDTKVKILIWT